jgi:hypothetical protein
LLMATVHPSSILRLSDPDRTDAMKMFVADLRGLAAALD